MGFVIFQFQNYFVVKFLFLLLYSASASALHVSRMVEKNNNHRARHYVPETEKLERMFTPPRMFTARGAPRKVSARDFSKSAARAPRARVAHRARNRGPRND